MNLYGYVRVSGLGQVEKDGPDRQKEAIHAFCTRNNVNLCGTFFEKGVSGTIEGMERPEFGEMISVILKRRDEANKLQGPMRDALWVDGIVVEKLDRLARHLMVQEVIVRELRKHDIKLFDSQQAFEDCAAKTEDPQRELLRQIMGTIAQWDKSNTVKRLKHGRDKRRRETGKCEGAKRYGLLPGEDEILTQIIVLREHGWPYDHISACLNRKNLKTRFGRVWTWNNVFNVLNQQRQSERRKKLRYQQLKSI